MNDLVNFVLARHGGLARWQALDTVEARLSIAGGLFTIKGYPEGLRDVYVRIDTRRPRAEIAPYRALGTREMFEPRKVWIENTAGEVTLSREDPRAAFAGHVRDTPWDRLHRIYFTGYALWNYLTIPFLLAWPGFKLEELDAHVETASGGDASE